MPALTMLFTDVEGSTRLAAELGDRWPEVLAEHRAIVRGAITDAGGSVELTEGDSFFATFPDAPAAVRAAGAAQAALRAHPWPEQVGELRVRAGLHSGEVTRTDDHLVGLEVHRAARVGAAANGGQVLLTAATRERAGPGVRCEDVGMHRLKDFPEPMRLFHLVVHDDRPAAAFPPPRALDARPTNLPADERRIVGRDGELAAVSDALLLDGVRLVTICGLGGAGKTRTARAAATALLDAHRGGVWLVRAEGLTDVCQLVPAIAGVLDVSDDPDRELREAVVERLDGPPALLVLDNLEHLPGAGTIVADLLAGVPQLRILATSRTPLRLAAERVVRLGPLAPDDAIALFIERARSAGAQSSFDDPADRAALDEVCRRLDGLPLALELAAARARLLSPGRLAARLGSVLDLAGAEADRPERHRSLRVTVQWSLDLLPDGARRLFARLAVFSGPVPLEVIEEVCGSDGLDVVEAATSLLDFSLLRHDGDGLALVAALREPAAERLAAHEDEASLRRVHALAIAAAGERVTPLADSTREDRALAAMLLADSAAAVAWARGGDPGLHRRLVLAVSEYWAFSGRLRPALVEIDGLLAGAALAVADRCSLLVLRAHLLAVNGREQEALANLELGAPLIAEHAPALTGQAAYIRSIVCQAAGDTEAAIACGQAAIDHYRLNDQPSRLLSALTLTAQACCLAGDLDRAGELLDEADALATGIPSLIAAMMPLARGDLLVARRDPAAALAAYSTALATAEREPPTAAWTLWLAGGIVTALCMKGETIAGVELGAALERAAGEQSIALGTIINGDVVVGDALAGARDRLAPAEREAATAAGSAVASTDLHARAAALTQTALAAHRTPAV